MTKQKLVQCSTKVDRNAVRRTIIDGVEHVIVSSYTLPDNVVMNGGLYPADEIEKGFASLERTLAPVEHPHDANGNYISANDPIAIHNFHAGAFNVNVTRVDGRVHVEKFINVQEAMRTDRGKRLMDRIVELETNEKARPIHTSVGVWLDVEDTDGPVTNSEGQEYTWIARNMVFDHDAILLDSVGAAQPHQGVGMAVNKAGAEVEVEVCTLSQSDRMSQLDAQLHGIITADWINIVDILDDAMVIFETNSGYYQVPFTMDGENASIVGLPVRVDKTTTYTPKVNHEEKTQMNEEQIGEVIANAIKPLVEKLTGLEAKLNAADSAEVEKLAAVVVNSGKYEGIDLDAAKALPVATLKNLAANCTPSHGVPLFAGLTNNNADIFSGPAEMPE